MTPPGVYYRYKGRTFKKPLTVGPGQWIVFGGGGRAYVQEHGPAPRTKLSARKLGGVPSRPVIRTVTWVQCEPTWIKKRAHR